MFMEYLRIDGSTSLEDRCPHAATQRHLVHLNDAPYIWPRNAERAAIMSETPLCLRGLLVFGRAAQRFCGAAVRESAIRKFNAVSSSAFIFLLSIRAAGRGLNLQSADTVVIYDPDPNPKNEEQARLHLWPHCQTWGTTALPERACVLTSAPGSAQAAV